jgi:hypothetical protein
VIRIAFSAASKRAIERRATSAMNGKTYCEQCGAECPTRADYELDHILAEALQPDERLPLSAEHGKLLCLNCHDKKTRRDVAAISRAKRLAKEHRVVSEGRTEIARRFSLKQQEPER